MNWGLILIIVGTLAAITIQVVTADSYITSLEEKTNRYAIVLGVMEQMPIVGSVYHTLNGVTNALVN